MKLDDMARSGRLKQEATSKEKIAEFLSFAEDEISAARFNRERFPLTAYKSAYDALIHAGNALIRHYGYRPTAKYTHATITDVVERALGKDYSDLVRGFKRMRRKRHPLQYDAVFSESRTEVGSAILKSKKLLRKIEEHIGIFPDTKRLF